MKQPATLPTLRRQGAALTVLALAVVLAALAGLCFGSQGYTPLQLWQAWCSGDPQNAVYHVLLHVRWPRTLAGLLAGSALAAAGVTVAVLSNNRSPRRVQRFCAGLGIDFVGHAQKPSRRGYRRALEKFKTPQEHTAMLGDKLLTDILGAKRSGVLALMVEPKGGARGPWQKVLHALQEPFKRASAHDERTARQ